MTVCTITLGHDGLTTDAQSARFLLSDSLATAGDILATFLDGAGQWETDDGEVVTETCDAWIVNVPADAIGDLRTLLSAYASTFGQDALGCIVHDDRVGSSFCEAPA